MDIFLWVLIIEQEDGNMASRVIPILIFRKLYIYIYIYIYIALNPFIPRGFI